MRLKKRISFILVIVVILSALNITALAGTDEDALMTQFVDSVFLLKNQQEFLDAFELFQTVNDPNGLATTYEKAFNALGGSQQDKVLAFGVTVPLIKELATRANTTTVTADILAEWFKDGDKASFRTFAESIKTVIYSIGDASKIATSFAKMDEVFALLKLQKIAKVAIFQTTQAYGDLVVLNAGIDTIIEAARLVKLVDIQNPVPVYNAMGELVKYYNLASDNDRKSIFKYFNKYDFVVIVGGGGGNTNSNGNDEEIIDDKTPHGVPNFADLKGYDWALEAINALATAGVINGRGNDKFAPKDSVTRAEFATMISRMLSLKGDVSKLTFKDVKPTDWFAVDVAAAFEAKIIEGKNATTYGPNDKITRQEMAIMIGRVLIYFGKEAALTDSEIATVLGHYSDGNSVSEWAKGFTALVVKKGIITGIVVNGETKTLPNKNATRAECAVMLYRLASHVETVVIITK